jgi:uncharacterized protein YbjT (DUF2867 family)
MTSPVLVTGGTGRLGRSVVARLVEAGREVRVLARTKATLSHRSRSTWGIFGRASGLTRPCMAPE